MQHIPFLEFPRAEQRELLAAVRQSGLSTRGVCASRVQWDDAAGFASVTVGGVCRSYPADAGAGWIEALRRDLSPAVRG